MVQVKKALNSPLSAVKTYRPRLRGSRRHNWIHRRLTSRAWTSSDPLGCTLRLCLMPLRSARVPSASAQRRRLLLCGPFTRVTRIASHVITFPTCTASRHFVICGSTNFKSLHLPRRYNGSSQPLKSATCNDLCDYQSPLSFILFAVWIYKFWMFFSSSNILSPFLVLNIIRIFLESKYACIYFFYVKRLFNRNFVKFCK